MRQQYHSRPVGDERHIWDVNALVRCVKGLSVKKVSLSSIQELDEDYWYEEASPTCKSVAEHAKLIDKTDLRHPIILCANGRVMDGMHRVCKAYMLGHEDIDAVQFEVTPEPDYKDIDLRDLPYDT